MNKKKVLTLCIMFVILLSGMGEAFVPKSAHLIYLVIGKIKQPVGIEAYQIKKIINYTDLTTGYVEFEERLIYAFPNRFRSEVISGHVKGFHVETQSQYVKVIDGVVVSRDKSLLDRYSDILLYRDYKSLLEQLTLAGVDTETVTLKRYKGTVCYVIGRSLGKGKPYAGLWIEKDSLFPVKYVVKDETWAVEFLYDNWQRVSKTWYPMRTSIFWDDQLYAMMDVQNFTLKKGGPDALFDIDYILQAYPDNESIDIMDENSRQVKELDKSIKEFGKLYE